MMFLPVTSASDSSREGIKEEKEPRAPHSLFPSLPAGYRHYRPSSSSSPAAFPPPQQSCGKPNLKKKERKKKSSGVNGNHVLIAFLFVPGLTGSRQPCDGTPQIPPKPGAIGLVEARGVH